MTEKDAVCQISLVNEEKVSEVRDALPDDTVFTPGLAVPFSISVFDSTFTEHHVLDMSAELLLVKEANQTDSSTALNRRDRYEPLDF